MQHPVEASEHLVGAVEVVWLPVVEALLQLVLAEQEHLVVEGALLLGAGLAELLEVGLAVEDEELLVEELPVGEPQAAEALVDELPVEEGLEDELLVVEALADEVLAVEGLEDEGLVVVEAFLRLVVVQSVLVAVVEREVLQPVAAVGLLEVAVEALQLVAEEAWLLVAVVLVVAEHSLLLIGQV